MGALGPVNFLIDPIESHHPVGQTGQDVEVGLAMELGLLLPHLLGHGIECPREQSQFVRGLHFDERVFAAADVSADAAISLGSETGR